MLLGVNMGGRQSSCLRSVSSVLEAGFRMVLFVYPQTLIKCVLKSDLDQIRLAPKFPELYAFRELPVFEFRSSECDYCM